jgi:hypothetical protein
MSEEEKDLIRRAVRTSLQFGLGLTSECKRAIIENGFKWTGIHEKFVFEVYDAETSR